MTLFRDKLFIGATLFFIALYALFCRYNVLFNYTHSLPQKIFIVDVGNKNLKVGDYAAFHSEHLPNTLNGMKIIKIISGVQGDVVDVKDNEVFINNKYLTKIYTRKAIWGEITPIDKTVIPKDCYFMEGTARTSFDSRYKEFGLICKDQIIGKAFPYF